MPSWIFFVLLCGRFEKKIESGIIESGDLVSANPLLLAVSFLARYHNVLVHV